MPEMIDVAEAAELTGLKPSTLYKYAQNGVVTCVKYETPTKNPKRRNRGAVRFYRSDIIAFVKSHRREAL